MASIHIGAVTSKGSHIPDAKVEIAIGCGGGLPACKTGSFVLFTGADGVASHNLGDFCFGPSVCTVGIKITTPRGKVATDTWTFTIPPLDNNRDVVIPDADDEGSRWADAAAWWGSLGPVGQAGVVLGLVVVGGLAAYGITRYVTRPKKEE